MSVAPEPDALVVTAGARGARAWVGEQRWTVSAPRQVPVNPIGAGDAVAAGIAVGLAAGVPWPDVLADGVAWGAAKVHEFDLDLDPEIAHQLRSEVRVQRRPASHFTIRFHTIG